MARTLTARLDAATGLRILCGAPDCRSELGSVWWLATPRVEIRERRCPTHGDNEIRTDRLQAEWDRRRPVAGLSIRPAAGYDRQRASGAARRLAQDPSDLGPPDAERTRRLEKRRDPR